MDQWIKEVIHIRKEQVQDRSMNRDRGSYQVQVPIGAGRLLHRPVDLDLNVGPSAISYRIPVITGLDT